MLEIRTLTPEDDLQAVGELYAESWKQAYQRLLPQRFLDKLTHDRWTALLRAEPEASLGMYEDGELIGTAMLGFGREEGREGCGEVVSLYLQPEKTGQGYGTCLLEAVMQHLRQHGCETVYLWVMCGSTRAVHFYVRRGFHPTGRIQQENYGGEPVELMELQRRL